MPAPLTVYPRIGVLPTAEGGFQCTLTAFWSGRIRKEAGAAGGVSDLAAGVTTGDGREAGPVPTRLVARTLNVYAVPLASPGTTAYPNRRNSSTPTVTLCPPGDAVTTYPVTGPACSTKVGFQATYAALSAPNAVTRLGASGTAGPSKRAPRISRYSGSRPARSRIAAGTSSRLAMMWLPETVTLFEVEFWSPC